MRTRATLPALMLSLGLGLALASCQIVAGLTVLEITTGSTGTGTGGNGGTTSATGGGGTGGACAMPVDCGADTTCRTFTCTAGACSTTDAMAGKACTESGGELCDGKGQCVPPSCMDVQKNGMETDVDCGGSCGKCVDGKGCLATSDCVNGSYCAKSGDAGAASPGVCKKAKPLGAGCADADECDSEFCTEGVCCQTGPCVGECRSCAIAGTGKCEIQEGAPCGDTVDSECSAADTCSAAGNCLPNHAPASTSCGVPTSNDCTLPDTCDGAGKCKPNDMPVNTPCGDVINDTCTDPDTCDGAGTCLANNVPNNTACGGGCFNDVNSPASVCTDGGCGAAGASCPNGAACKADHTGCFPGMCTQRSECSATSFCALGVGMCAGCGITPPMAPQCSVMAGVCESCGADQTCINTCDVAGECMGNKIYSAMGPKRIECNNQCNNITIGCQGPFGCEVVCNQGGCQNLVLNCDVNGPCKLTCVGNGCQGATVHCGDNACEASCANAVPVTQDCKQSCGCSKVGCQ